MIAVRKALLTCSACAILVVPGAEAMEMSEDVRASVTKIAIFGAEGATGESVKGSYNENTPGLLGGMAKGAEIGTIPVEVGGVPIGIPIPILREIGMIAGGISGKAKEQIQEFRDRLTDDLRSATDQPLSNDSLANDVYWGLRNAGDAEPTLLALETPAPEDTDARLYVALTDFGINVQGDEAVIETVATARLVRHGDGTTLYATEVRYSDRDTLRNWTDNDTVLWREYRNFARHYLGREIAALLYERIDVDGKLAPTASADVKRVKGNDWTGESRTLLPTLAWDFALAEDNARDVDPASITWDLEIYDARRPVYSARRLQGSSHKLTAPLQACGNYRWTVRPKYVVDGITRNGDWMRNTPVDVHSNGNVGRSASTAHAYIQDFASLAISCKAN
jgi:hypothetical protein